MWWPEGDTNPEGHEIEDLFSSLNLSQIITEPTNFTPHKRPSCIDLIATDQPNLILDSGTLPSLDSVCHHNIIYCKINFHIPPPPPHERKIWHYSRANIEGLKRSISQFPWRQHLSLNQDPNWQVKSFTEIVLNVMSNFIPNQTKRFTNRGAPWISRDLKAMINRKNRFYKNYKRRGFKPDDKITLDNLRSNCQEAVESAKYCYLQNLGNKLNDPMTSQKCYWKLINRAMNKCRTPKIPPLFVNSHFILNCHEKAKFFDDFCSQQCKPIINDSVLPTLDYLTNERIDSIQLSENDILTLIRNLDPNKATGSDGISCHMLRLCDNSIVLPLKLIFENILASTVYPDLWKKANVTPVHKKNDKQQIKNYRPISMLPICGKMLEKIIFNRLYSYLSTQNLITKNQSGFRPGDSTTNQLLYFTNEIHKAFDDPKSLEVRSIFLDISKAFDKVWHEGLIFKLERNGISGNVLKLLKSYLANRKQRVALNGVFSEYANVESGVPQGSVLGPLLFLVYINDLEENIRSKIRFFADDTMLFSIVNDNDTSATELQHDLNLIGKWAYQWKLEFNPDPTKQATELLFSCKSHSTLHPQLFFNNNPVSTVTEHKHLGLILEPKLIFSKHINEKISKANKNIGILRHLSKFLPIQTLDQMYKALVRSHLDYCDIIYHIPAQLNPPPLGLTLPTLMEKVEQIQYKAALAITGAWRGSSRVKIYEELGWETLSDRRNFRRILQMHKILNNNTPPYLKACLPRTRRPFLDAVFHEVRCRKQKYFNSFFPNSIKSWNMCITNFEHFPSYAELKRFLLPLMRPFPKSVFGLHDPFGVRILFQLRLGLSSLRSHKKRYNFSDTPSEVCLCNNGPESTAHFLLLCPFYATQRIIMLNNVENILTANNILINGDLHFLLLYGHSRLDTANNKFILNTTIKFIKSTNRFS